MGWYCVLCDEFLPIFQLSKLCEVCYKTRTIVKAYSAETILKSIEEHFLVEGIKKVEIMKVPSVANLPEITSSDDQKDYDKPKKNNKVLNK